MRKTLRISCRSKDECLDLINELLASNVVKGRYVKWELKGKNLVIEIDAPPSRIDRVVLELKRLRGKGVKQGTHTGITVSELMKTVGKPFIPDALRVILKHSGYEVEIDGEVIRTNAPMDTLVKYATEVAKRLEELVFYKPKASASAKKLVTALSVLMGSDPFTVIEILKDMDYVIEKGHRLLVKKQWKEVLREVLKRLVHK
ncbi:MAG TPA: DUF2067 domain-containing protein [Acidilobales archaeon]|nr:DUF2067 domain-containing protein [Acidilobales archaeon]